MIDRATVDKILDAANIVDVVSEFVTLRKSGVNYKGLCPFHDDRNPSFMVSPSKNICHCFVCGKGGTPAGFLMEHEQITYPEALRWLARKYNIEIVEKELTDEERREQGERESMFIVNEWAKGYFHDILSTDPDGQAIGRQYFRSRGIRDDIIEKFQLGYSPNQRDALATAAQKAGYKAEYLVKTGLCYARSEDGGTNNEGKGVLVDRYRGRVVFPWFNVSGKVVAFGGRLLDSRTKGVAQKYVNSPDSEIYHKERELYGLFQAKRAIVKEDCVYMVEGYTDVIAMHQCGLENVVANSGTALSEYQIHILHRFTQNIVLLYDGDEAGIHAAMRGTDMLLGEGMNIKVLLLPDGDDPDSFSRKHTAEEFRAYIEQHQTDFIQFKTDQLLKGVTDPIKRSEAISSIVKSVSVIPDQITRDTYLRECVMRLGINEQTLINTMNKFIRSAKEEKEKERERELARSTHAAASQTQGGASPSEALQQGGGLQQEASLQTVGTLPDGPAATASELQTSLLIAQSPHAAKVEELLVKSIIRHGEEIIFDGLETEDGQSVSLSVAQYVDYDLSQDGLQFSNPLYNRILAEAVEHNNEPGFKANTYFLHHPDLEVSQLASRMSVDAYQLGRGFVVKEREGSLRQHIQHLILDLRLDIVVGRLKQIQVELRQAGSDMERIRQLLQEYKDTQVLRDALARQLGLATLHV